MPDEKRDRPTTSPAREASPRDIEVDRPNPSRMYDYYLGGAHNFAVDREAADKVLAILPATRTFARDNRAFLQRAVRFLVGEAGIRQFLDIGSGIPTVGNVHEIAQAADPECRVVYVDHEPVAVAQSRRLLADNPRATVIAADMRQPDSILAHPSTRKLLDFSRPIGLLMVAVIPFIADSDNPAGLVATYRDVCAPGSYLAMSHSLTMDYWPGAVAEAVEMYSRSTHPLHLRTPKQVLPFFDGYDLVDPGLVMAAAWRPDQPTSLDRAKESRSVAGVGMLRSTR